MSDQDFFFDDDKPADKASKSDKTPAKKPSGASTRPAAKSSGSKQPVPESGQSVTMTMAIMFAVIGLLVGVIVGLFVGNMMNAGSSAVLPASGGSAPALSQDQLNGGQLPAGHPSVGGATGGGTGAGTGSATTGGSSTAKPGK